MQVGEGQQVQIVQAAATQGSAQTAQAQGQTMQVMQQIITNTGEIQQIPVRNGFALKAGLTGGWKEEWTSLFIFYWVTDYRLLSGLKFKQNVAIR